MAWTAHKDPEQIKEHKESDSSVDKKAETVAKWIKDSKHLIFFTGAGVSTSAGIPDFRGPNGVWTLRAQGKETTGGVSSMKAIPTASHMSIVGLLKSGLAKYLISQNTDGLHRKSGVPPDKISELHGNSNLEICAKCGKQYIRDYRTRTAAHVNDHRTGRNCAKCGGELNDSIINFGESLPQIPMRKAFDNSYKSDLCIVLGSSLTVTPAADMPKAVAQHGGKLVICNLQQTPLDSLATLRVFATTDEFMKKVMQKLGLEVPEWRLHRRLVLGNTYDSESKAFQVYARGIDVDGTPVSFVRSLNITGSAIKTTLQKEPFDSQPFPSKANYPSELLPVHVTMNFMGNYLEPPLEMDHNINTTEPYGTVYHLEYNPFRREWKIDTERSFGLSDLTKWTNKELKEKLTELKLDTKSASERQDLINMIAANYKGV